MTKITPVLLAGGAGTRLWPVSRDSLPKQFLPLTGDLSTFQETLKRVGDASLFDAPVIFTHADFRFLAQEQIAALGVTATIVLEPERRDSAAAIAAAAAFVQRQDPDAVVVALAADHVVLDPELFLEACRAGLEAALQGRIVTFGIAPTDPKTSYGYIAKGAAIAPSVFEVARFVEKPDARTAIRYIEEGYVWNSGNFMFRADVMMAELERLAPDVAAPALKAVEAARLDLDFVRLDEESYAEAQRISIDYAVMEKTDKAAIVEGRFRWSDIGSWEAVWEWGERDADGNAALGDAEFVLSTQSLAYSDGPLVTLVGVENVVAVATRDAVLVVDRTRSQEVKGLVQHLEGQNRKQVRDHRQMRRPWGHYDSVDSGERFQVKRITVWPGKKLSLQKHMHRSEHWVVVRGTAEVTVDEMVALVHENESIYIPIGAVHRLANPGRIPLELIEVQTGSYLGEDDIIRIEDDFNRA